MTNILYVGDVHATVDEMGDCQNLIDFICEVVLQEKPDAVVFLGDIYHTHAILRLEVLDFWRASFAKLKFSFDGEIIVLVGNHDRPGVDGSKAHSLLAHLDQVTVIGAAPMTKYGIRFVPYRSDPKIFIAEANEDIESKLLVCHQTFDGAQYENGFYASDGIDPNLLNQQTILSGHIHLPSAFGKVTYIGSPRWRTLSDANTQRAIWLLNHEDNGTIASKKSFDTGTVCKQIFHLTDTPEDPVSTDLDPKHEYRIDLRGPSDWIESRKTEFSAKARIRTFPTKVTSVRVKESDGIHTALWKYFEGYEPKHSTPKDLLKQTVKERFGG